MNDFLYIIEIKTNPTTFKKPFTYINKAFCLINLDDFFTSKEDLLLMQLVPFSLLLCLVLPFQALSQDATQKNLVKPTTRFEAYSTDEGLANNSIKAILIDERGFVWLGTRDGLSKFDAFEFETFIAAPTEDNNLSKGLSDSHVLALAQSKKDEKIWIGTNNGGLNYFDYSTKNFYHYPVNPQKEKALHALTIQALAIIQENETDKIWIGTKRDGLQALDIETQEFESVKSNKKDSTSLYNDNVVSLLVDKQKQLWVATTVLQLYLGEGRFDTFIFPDGESSISAIELVNDSQILVTTWDSGIYLFDIEKKEFVKHIKGAPTTAATQDTDGNIWLSTFGAGILKYNADLSDREAYKVDRDHDYGLKEGLAWDIKADDRGGIWLGLYSEGLHYLSPKNDQFKIWVAPQKGFRSTTTWSFSVQGNSTIWVGTDAGLYEMNFTEGYDSYTTNLFHPTQTNPNQKIPSSLITSLLKSSSQELWIGTWEGLAKLSSDRKLKIFESARGSAKKLAGNKITALEEDSEKNIWVGMLYGLAKYNVQSKTFEHYYPSADDANSLNEGYIATLLSTSSGEIWVGTRNGLHIYQKETNNFKRLLKDDKKNSISHNQINALYEDEEGIIWIGTNGGLNSFDGSKFEHFTTSDGLVSNVIQGITTDYKGNIWLTTNKGLIYFDRKANTFRSYDHFDGLQSNDFKRGAIARLPNGVIFVGGKEGFNAFHPDYLTKDNFAPQTYFTDFKLFGKSLTPKDSLNEDSPLQKPISETTEMVLSHKDRVIEFDFTALSYYLPQKSQFAYKMEGFDKDWLYTDANRRFATYTSLPAGNYVFKVKAANSGGEWSEAEKMKIRVTPPFYLTWWFMTITPALLLVLGYSLYKNRVKNIQKRNLLLEQTVKERTQEINQKNEELKTNNEELHEKHHEILVQNEELDQQREEILAQRDAIETQNHSLKDLNKTLEESYKTLNTLTNVGKQITSVLDLKQVIRQVYEQIQHLMPAEGFGIGLYRPEKNTLFYTGYIEKETVLDDHEEKLDQNSFGNWALSTQKSVFINDLEDEYHKYIHSLGGALEGDHPEALIYVPLSLTDRKIGVLTVQSFEKYAYTSQHVSILKSLATYIAIALQNAETYRELDLAHEETNHINLKLTDSIRYAETIQQSILSVHQRILKNFSECEIIYRPASVVSGDFYWFSSFELSSSQRQSFEYEVQDEVTAKMIVVADCTGHGVPGAFMSLIGNGLLNEIILQRGIIEPKEILSQLHKGLRLLLRQNQEENPNQDGMDVSLCLIMENRNQKENKKIVYSGAKRPLYYSVSNELIAIKGNRKSVGGRQKEKIRSFEHQQLELKAGDSIYLFTDGIADQNNNEMERIGSQNLFKKIASFQSLPIKEQKQQLETFLEEHQGDQSQRDDITMVMIRL